jgi:hypothetical protein
MQWWLVYIIIQSIITSYVIQEYVCQKGAPDPLYS